MKTCGPCAWLLVTGLIGCSKTEGPSSGVQPPSLTDDPGAVSDTGVDDEPQADSDADADADADVDSDTDSDTGAFPDWFDPADSFGVGEPDSISSEVCALLELEAAIPMVLASSADEAAMASVTLGDSNELLLEMPASGDGYLQVEVPDWMTTVRIFSHGDATYEVFVAEEGSERVPAGSCPEDGITDHLWFFHEWGSYTIRIAEGSPADTWLTLYKF